MVEEKIYYAGFLSNVDSSILGLKLNHGFEIKPISEDEGMRFLSILDGSTNIRSRKNMSKRISYEYRCLSDEDGRFYTINNTFLSTKSRKWGKAVIEFDVKFIRQYLRSVLRLMRLFKEGNISTPLEYYYLIKNNRPKPLIRLDYGGFVSYRPYKLEISELPELKEFLQRTKLPFLEPYVQLAFGNLELSYSIDNNELSFLTLMVGMEALFNPSGGYELTYTISRNCAVLLGKDKEDSFRIFNDVKRLYGKRSKIVHGAGKSRVIENEDLLKLRGYLRESIKKMERIGKDKETILSLLNSSGFTEKPW